MPLIQRRGGQGSMIATDSAEPVPSLLRCHRASMAPATPPLWTPASKHQKTIGNPSPTPKGAGPSARYVAYSSLVCAALQRASHERADETTTVAGEGGSNDTHQHAAVGATRGGSLVLCPSTALYT
jgi:hypothetical protein